MPFILVIQGFYYIIAKGLYNLGFTGRAKHFNFTDDKGYYEP